MAMDKVAMNDELLDQVTGGSMLPYVVQAGDTLSAIAKKYNVTLEQLMKWNNIKNPDILTIGQRLVIKF
ncbi:MAG: LysM peptidoglycan-binding domain-containing protein [Oscillospiraceae bacterium]|nr:LysM peptidoglycan-binding domain-containing protein [Oscillospiraceae bacterium]